MPDPIDRKRAGHILWNAAIVVALIAIVGLFMDDRQLAGALAQLDRHNQEQLARIEQDLAQSSAAAQKSVDALAQQAQDATAQAETRAKQDLRRNSASLSAALARQQQQLTGQLTDLQQANTAASAKIGEISDNVSGVKSDVASTQTQLEKTGNDLKRVMGDMGVMSGLIATNSSQLTALKELGDRDYLEFDLKKTAGRQKVGDMQLVLAKADPKHNRFTLQVLSDDKMVEKRDRSINEPVQMYVAGNRQPEEIVVNQVKKDEVAGYVAIPKVKVARR